MLNAWVLVVVMHVPSGVHVEFKTFSSKDTCVNALRNVYALALRPGYSKEPVSATCVPE